MATLAPIEQALTLVKQLEREEQIRLMHFVLDLLQGEPHPEPRQRYRWLDLEGMAPDLLEGEDAQAWVSRTRAESDEAREATWKREA